MSNNKLAAVGELLRGWVGRVFRNPGPTQIAIVVFILLAIVAWSTLARAQPLILETGSAIVRGETPSLGVYVQTPRASRGGDYNYECGFGLIGSSEGAPNQLFAEATIVDGWELVDVGVGLVYLKNDDRYNSGRVNFSLMLRWRFSERWWLTYRHYSNAGTSYPNLGRDRVMVSFVLGAP